MSDFETVAAMENPAARPGPAGEQDAAAGKPAKVRSLAGDAWRDLRRNPIFWISLTLVALVSAMAAFPGLFTANDPQDCVLSRQHVLDVSRHYESGLPIDNGPVPTLMTPAAMSPYGAVIGISVK